MSRIGDDLIKRRGLEACGLALLLCLLLVPGGLAQGVRRPLVRQTAAQSLTLIKPSDPDFEGMIDTYFPGLSDEPGYQKSIRPFLVIVRNDTALLVVAYAITWTLHYGSGRAMRRQTMFVHRLLMNRGALKYIPPGVVRLISPIFNVTNNEYERYHSFARMYPAKVFPRSKELTSVDVDVDGVVYWGGSFIGADKTRVLQRFFMARFAARDEILSALKFIQSSTAPQAIAVQPLEQMLNHQVQWGFEANQGTLLAMYVRARGRSAQDLERILRNRGALGLEDLLLNIVDRFGGNTNPSAFGREYPNLSRNDPRIFWVPPSRPKDPPPQALPGQGAPAQKQPFTLTLEAPKQPLKAGKRLLLRVKITNTSNHAVSVGIMGGKAGGIGVIYHVHVHDQRGHAVSRRPPPPASPHPKGTVVVSGIANFGGVGLEPGQSVNDLVNVTYYYDLSRPGKYKIWVAETFYGEPHNVPEGLVKSNTVTVTVVK